MNWKSFVLPALVCTFFIIASAAGIAWYATTPLLRGDIDGLLLVAICFLVGVIFFAQLLSISRMVSASVRARTERAFVGVCWKQATQSITGLQKTLHVWRHVFSRLASLQVRAKKAKS
jgi:hypothetical protein